MSPVCSKSVSVDALQDILKILKIPHALVLERSFDRPNLRYEVIGKSKEALQQLGQLLMSRFEKQCGIIYCLSKSESVEVSKFLNEKFKIKTAHYHAGLAARQRVSVQKKWYTGEVQIVCATIAFGMGIDKPDVVSLHELCIFHLRFFFVYFRNAAWSFAKLHFMKENVLSRAYSCTAID